VAVSKLEHDIKAEVMLALGSYADVLIMDNPSGLARYPGGAAVPYGVGLRHLGGSDLIGILRGGDGRGLFLAVELKSATGRQRAEQRAFEAAVRQRGGEYALIRSAGEARAWLEELRRRHG
jgi:hypothetical protein